jgi:hypothetical protein
LFLRPSFGPVDSSVGPEEATWLANRLALETSRMSLSRVVPATH